MDAAGSGAEADRRRSRDRRLLLWGGAAVVAAGLLVAAFELTSTPGFCDTCHEMQPAVAGWRDGSHDEVSCIACHADPGVIGYLEVKLGDGSRDVWVHFTDRPEQIADADVPPRRCLECHEDEFAEAELPEGHPPRTAECWECHRRQIHTNGRPGPE